MPTCSKLKYQAPSLLKKIVLWETEKGCQMPNNKSQAEGLPSHQMESRPGRSSSSGQKTGKGSQIVSDFPAGWRARRWKSACTPFDLNYSLNWKVDQFLSLLLKRKQFRLAVDLLIFTGNASNKLKCFLCTGNISKDYKCTFITCVYWWWNKIEMRMLIHSFHKCILKKPLCTMF